MLFGRYKFVIRLQDDAQLPYYKGSTFRGVLGHALKKVVCALKNQECATCILRSNCTYAMVFETAHAIELPEGARISSPPHPAMLEPPLTTKTRFKKGETLTCTLVLFGELNHSLHYFIYAFDQMGKIGIGKKNRGHRSRFILESVTSKGDEEVSVYNKKNHKITLPENFSRLIYGKINNNPCFSGSKEEISTFSMEIITPLRIIARDAPVARLLFSVLMASIIRRTTSLMNVYGNGEPDLDYSGMVDAAREINITENSLQWLDWKRYSLRQDKKMFMGGLIGSISYEGDFSCFLSMMAMAEKVHIGKNTAFGLGKIVFNKPAGSL